MVPSLIEIEIRAVFGIRWGVLKQSYNRAVAQRMQGI